MKRDKYLKVFQNCIPVKGARRSIIYDLQRVSYDFIPNALYDFLTYYDGKEWDTIAEMYKDPDEREILDEYVNFLLDKEYIFFTEHPENFPPLNLDWDYPRTITNCIIDFNRHSNHDLEKISDELKLLRCEAIELRFFEMISTAYLKKALSHFSNTTIRSINLTIGYNLDIEKNILYLYEQFPLVNNILIYSYPKNCEASFKDLPIFTTELAITDASHCGVIDSFNFSINITAFTEAYNYNSCLNRKIGIDINGNIKNCPSMDKSYGNIANTSLLCVVNNPDFQRVWNIKKDQIHVCQACEFRYMCTDCRAHTEDKTDRYSKPLKCNYDPYTLTYK